jgi:ribosomal protein L19E
VQLTIDSSQKLDDVIRVVGALYNVQLGVVGTAATKTVVASSRGRGRGRTVSSRGSANRGSGRRPNRSSASTAEMRAWAQTNGYHVNSRGRIPMTVKNAFEAKGS